MKIITAKYERWAFLFLVAGLIATTFGISELSRKNSSKNNNTPKVSVHDASSEEVAKAFKHQKSDDKALFLTVFGVSSLTSSFMIYATGRKREKEDAKLTKLIKNPLKRKL